MFKNKCNTFPETRCRTFTRQRRPFHRKSVGWSRKHDASGRFSICWCRNERLRVRFAHLAGRCYSDTQMAPGADRWPTTTITNLSTDAAAAAASISSTSSSRRRRDRCRNVIDAVRLSLRSRRFTPSSWSDARYISRRRQPFTGVNRLIASTDSPRDRPITPVRVVPSSARRRRQNSVIAASEQFMRGNIYLII